MSQTQILVSSWACLTFLTILSGMGSLYVRRRPIVLKLADFMNLALATAAIVSSCSLIYRAVTLKELETLSQF